MGRRRRKGGEGGYIRIQNLSSYDVELEIVEGRNIDDMGMDQIQGTIPSGAQLPEEGKEPFEDGGGVYQYIEGDVRNRLQKDGYCVVNANVEDSSPSSLCLKVDHNSWCSQDKSPDADSKIKLLAAVDEEDGMWKIELRIYNNYDTKCWMAQMEDDLNDTPLCQVGLPGTHDSGTYAFDKDKGASPDSDLTSTIEDKLDKGRLLGKLTDFILKQVFERLCRCQDKSIKEQLERGVRYLDLRVARHEDSGEFWTCHGVFCVNMTEIMQEVNDFLTENPKEIVILDINHVYGLDDRHEEFLDSVYDVLGDKAANRDDGVSLMSPLSEYWDKGFQAVVFYKKHGKVKEKYGGKVWPLHMISSPWPDTGDTDELHDKLKENVESRDAEKLFVLQGILTPDAELIKKKLWDGDGISIKTFSERCSCKVVDWCEDEFKQHSLNIVIIDFFENCCMIPSIIGYNRK